LRWTDTHWRFAASPVRLFWRWRSVQT
jgi:hypothetical protein